MTSTLAGVAPLIKEPPQKKKDCSFQSNLSSVILNVYELMELAGFDLSLQSDGPIFKSFLQSFTIQPAYTGDQVTRG
jgi:hypothetical protein